MSLCLRSGALALYQQFLVLRFDKVESGYREQNQQCYSTSARQYDYTRYVEFATSKVLDPCNKQ